MRLSEAVEELLIATRAAGRSPRTTANYAEKAACLVEFLGDAKVEQVTLREKGDKVRYGFFSDLTRRVLVAWLEVRPTDNRNH